MEDRWARLLTNRWFLLGTLFCLAYFFALASLSHQPQTTALVGVVCYAYFVLVSLLMTRA